MAEVSESISSLTPLLKHEPPSPSTLTSRPSECRLADRSCFLNDGSSIPGRDQVQVQRKLVFACVLCFAFMLLEAVGGYWANSVAIMSDAAHMLSDMSAFAVSLFAAWAVTRKSHVSYSFGYHRAEIVGALVSILIIWLITGALVFEAVQRTINPVPVNGKVMFIVAVAALVFNLALLLVVGHHHHHGECSGGSHDHADHDHTHSHNHSRRQHHDHHGCSSHSHTHQNPAKRKAPDTVIHSPAAKFRTRSGIRSSLLSPVLASSPELHSVLVDTGPGSRPPPSPFAEVAANRGHTHNHEHGNGCDHDHAHHREGHGLGCSHDHVHAYTANDPYSLTCSQGQEHSHTTSDPHSLACSHGHENKQDSPNVITHVGSLEHNHTEECNHESHWHGCSHDDADAGGMGNMQSHSRDDKHDSHHGHHKHDSHRGHATCNHNHLRHSSSKHKAKHNHTASTHTHTHNSQHTTCAHTPDHSSISLAGNQSDNIDPSHATFNHHQAVCNHSHNHDVHGGIEPTLVSNQSGAGVQQQARGQHAEQEQLPDSRDCQCAVIALDTTGSVTTQVSCQCVEHSGNHDACMNAALQLATRLAKHRQEQQRRADEEAALHRSQAVGCQEGHLGLRSAFIHILGDMIQSIGVALAGALIWWNEGNPRWYYADPICTYLFSIMVLLTTRAVLRDIIDTLMERTPVRYNLKDVAQDMGQFDGIHDVHDLHIWNLSMGLPILTAHVHISSDACAEDVLSTLERYVNELGISHSTIQICNIPSSPNATGTIATQ